MSEEKVYRAATVSDDGNSSDSQSTGTDQHPAHHSPLSSSMATPSLHPSVESDSSGTLTDLMDASGVESAGVTRMSSVSTSNADLPRPHHQVNLPMNNVGYVGDQDEEAV